MRSSWLALLFVVVVLGRDALAQNAGAAVDQRDSWYLTVWQLEDPTATPELPDFELEGLRGLDPPPGRNWRKRHDAYGTPLTLPESGSLSPKLRGNEPELIRFDGRVRIPSPGFYRFGVETNAPASELRIAASATPIVLRNSDPAWSEWIELDTDSDVLVSAMALRTESAEFMLIPRWERRNDDDRGFRAEPITNAQVAPMRIIRGELGWIFEEASPDRRRQDPPRLQDASVEQHVRFGELGCLNCHANTDPTLLPLPTRKGPDLIGIGERLHSSWLAEWIANPQSSKPGSGMPDLFRDTPADDADLEALLAYLLNGSAPEEQSLANEPQTLARGRELYHTVGCIACHGALESPADVFGDNLYSNEIPDVDVAAPLVQLHEKWRPRALATFLKDPRAHRPDSPMPSMNLSDEEADLIATYLLGRSERHAPEAQLRTSGELVERGRAVFSERNCASCHVAPDATERAYTAPVVQPLSGWRSGRGCLDPNDAESPRYVLSDDDRDAIAQSWRATTEEHSEAPLEHARRTYTALNCQACHARDGQGGLPDELRPYFIGLEESAELGDEARIPPELSGVGRKLTTPWLEEVLTNSGRARPYMAARMPQFAPDEVKPLAHGLAHLDGVFPHTDREAPAVTDEQVLAGKRLMGIRGLACISCHVVGDLPPAGTPGPDMTQFAARLRYDWFRDYMHDPARFKPGTRMPQFTTKGQSAIRDLWDGDAERQIDAMWAYFSLGEFLPVPAGVPKPGELALVPKDRPVVFRTFLESVGSKAICVGTPSGLHYAFDAEKVRLAEVWKGDFVDASANWTARGGGEASGRGEVTWEDQPDVPIVFGFASGPEGRVEEVSEAKVDFQGYRLDSSGAPTFVYDLAFDHDPSTPGDEIQCRVDEAVIPYPRAGIAFARMFAVRGLPPGGTLLFAVREHPGFSIGLPDDSTRPGRSYLSTWARGRGLGSPFGAMDDHKFAAPNPPLTFFGVEATEPTTAAGKDEPMIFSIEVAE